MVTIAQSQMLLRASSELPDGLKFATEEFCEDWDFVRSAGALRLERMLVKRGWSFASPSDGSLGNGVGDACQQAIGNALRLALRNLGGHFNAAEVEHIELTHYPWFFLARVSVLPYCIRQGAMLPMPKEAKGIRALRRQKRPPMDSGTLYSHVCSSMPRLKQMLILSHGSPNQPLYESHKCGPSCVHFQKPAVSVCAGSPVRPRMALISN